MKSMNIAQNINHLYGITSICQCSFNRPSFNPIPKGTKGNAFFSRPVCQTHRFTAVSDHFVGSLISILNFRGSPLAIFLAVGAVHIKSLYGHAFRSLAHVIIEVLKFVPLSANRDSSTPVVCKSSRIFIKTSIPHFLPRLVCPRSFSALSGTLSMFRNHFGKETSAAQDVTRTKVASINYYFISSITSTVPKRPARNTILSLSATLIRNHNQATKSIPDNVNQLHTINAVRSSVQRLLLPARTSNNIHYTVTA